MMVPISASRALGSSSACLRTSPSVALRTRLYQGARSRKARSVHGLRAREREWDISRSGDEAAYNRQSTDDDVVFLEGTVVEKKTPAALQPLENAYDKYVRENWRALPARYKIVASLSLAFMICNMDKVNMSVAIIPMSQQFGWSSSMVGIVQSSFFWGYLLVQLPGGYLASMFGGRKVLPAAVSTWSLATAMVPPLTTTIPSLAFSRALVGLGEGVAPSAVTDIIVKAVPPSERAQAVSYVFGGLHVGSILGLLASPFLINWFGWEGVFYIFGGAGLFWAFWFRSVLQDPSPDMQALAPKLSPNDGAVMKVGEKDHSIPWRAFLRNEPVRALMVTHFCHNWCHYTMLAWLPTFFKQGLSMDLAHASTAALFPPIASIAVASVSGRITDHFIGQGFKVAHVRKAAQCTAFLIPAACLYGASNVYTSDTTLTIALISIAVGLGSFSLSALYCTHQDISSKHASALLGLTNTSGTIPGILGVTAVGALMDLTHSWSDAFFYPTIVFFLLGAGVYTHYSRSEPQEFVDDSPFEWEKRLQALLPWGKSRSN